MDSLEDSNHRQFHFHLPEAAVVMAHQNIPEMTPVVLAVVALAVVGMVAVALAVVEMVVVEMAAVEMAAVVSKA